MACYHMDSGYRLENGGFTLNPNAPGIVSETTRPCGRCIGCANDRVVGWGVRAMHEARLYGAGFDNSFLTLTFSPEKLPLGGVLSKRDMQLFMKRLRFDIGNPNGVEPGRLIRDMIVGELGSLNDRPHYHALVFNWRFPDREHWRKSPSGFNLYRSRQLERLWPYGHCEIGDVTTASAQYCARYQVKRLAGTQANLPYEFTMPTGECVSYQPEFGMQSRRPGLGAAWFAKFGMTDCFPQDFIVTPEARKVPVPRYYDKLLERRDPGLMAEIKADREYKARALELAHPEEYTPRRIAAIEEVALAAFDRAQLGAL